MDKINRTLLGIEDIRLRQDAVERKVLASAVDAEGKDGNISFGNLDGKNMALTVVFDGGWAELRFNGDVAASGSSPLVAVVSGKGELRLTGEVKTARALVIGSRRTEGASIA